MVELIVGKKGKGKTKVLLDRVNGAVKEANGSIVYLDKSTKHMYELNNKVRLIDVSSYPIKNADEFQNGEEFADINNNPNFSLGLDSQDPNAALAFQMNSGMNFNNENQQKQQNAEKKVAALAQDLADESARVAELNENQAGDC